MPRSGPLQTNQRAVLTAIDASNGGDYRINYGGNTATAPTTSFWQFSITGTSTFNLNRVNSGGTSLNAISIAEDGTARFRGTSGDVFFMQDAGNLGLELFSTTGLNYVDFRVASGIGGDADYDFRLIQSSANLFNFTGRAGRSYEFNLPVVSKTNFTVEGNLTSIGQTGFISNPVSGAGLLQFNINGSVRWQIGQNGGTETGGASGTGGTDWQVARFDNSGANPTIPLFITRSDSRTTFLASGYRSGGFQSNHNQTTLTANRTVTWPNLDGRVVLQPDTAVTDGQLLIGNTSTGSFARTTLTAGTGISVTNGAGTITIAATGGGGGTSITTNRQTLSAALTLTSSSSNHQFLDPNGANRNVDLPTGFTGGFFVFKNIAAAGNAFVLNIRNPSATTIFTVPAQYTVSVVWDGTEWQVM